ncbi:hypothetical protein B9Z55_027712 [Caenorhabditis nigoni]|uniref:Uncharacterized protein n=1 Tax=Caenorhabditis nigoni TaxID=1611254 RepID=A0A2G5SEV0_9PELO|nr:hypothetical protein B9Z55_027712 [Caenorhabditis nigoni]
MKVFGIVYISQFAGLPSPIDSETLFHWLGLKVLDCAGLDAYSFAEYMLCADPLPAYLQKSLKAGPGPEGPDRKTNYFLEFSGPWVVESLAGDLAMSNVSAVFEMTLSDALDRRVTCQLNLQFFVVRHVAVLCKLVDRHRIHRFLHTMFEEMLGFAVVASEARLAVLHYVALAKTVEAQFALAR